MIAFYSIVWVVELLVILWSGPTWRAWDEYRRARRDFPRAQLRP